MTSCRRFLPLLLAVAALLASTAGSASAGSGAAAPPMSGTLDAELPSPGSAPPSFHPGGGGGRYFWYELENQSETLDWPGAIPDDVTRKLGTTTLDNGLSLLLGAGDCAKTPLSAYPPAYQDAARKVRAALGITSTDHCVLWDNYPNTPPDSPVSAGESGLNWPVPAWNQRLSAVPNNEIHNADPHVAGGVLANPPQAVAWNIRIWREGQAKSFFDRRVGLNVKSNGRDSDPPGTQQLDWWRGGITNSSCGQNISCLDGGLKGTGGLFSNGNAEAGPLGLEDANDKRLCQSRIATAPATIKFPGEKKPTANTAAWVNGHRRDLSKLSPHSYACYWSFPKGATGNKITEAIYLQWTLTPPGSFNTGTGSVHFEVVAPQSKMYAILINAISNREALLMPPAGDPTYQDAASAAFARFHNYFHVYTPNPGPPPPKKPCCDKPKPTTPEYESFDQPTLGIQVNADSPVPMRTQSLVSVQAIADNLDETQAIFGREVQLLHFTPQVSFDGANGGSTYPDSYVRYDSDAGERIPSSTFSGPQGQHVQQALLPQPAIPGTDAGIISANKFRMTWLKPTVQNPCPAWGWSLRSTNPWPYEPDKCAVDAGHVITGADINNPPAESQLPRNAWADSVSARVLYEARWVSRRPVSADNTWDPQWQSNFPLRCNGENQIDQTVAVASGACNQVFPLTFYTYSHPSSETAGINGDQWADGYVDVTDQASGDGLGAVGVRLRTNAPAKVSDSVLFHRDGGPDWAVGDTLDRQSSLINTKSGQPELWYCKPGLPAGANIVTGASAYRTGAPTKVPAAQENDQACAGYTVNWNWDWNTNMAPIQPDGSQDAQATNCDTQISSGPGRKSWPVPTFNALQQYDPSGAGDVQQWGQYSMYDGSNPIAGDPNWKALLTAGSYNWTIPYNGARPGNPAADGSAYSAGDCYRMIADGRQQPKNVTNTPVKGWVQTGTTTHDWVHTIKVPKQVDDTSKAKVCPAGHTVVKTTGKGKSKKVVTSCDVPLVYPKKTVMVDQQKTDQITDPVYGFQWTDSGDCHPQTAAQAAILTKAMKTKLVADDKVLYVTQDNVRSTFDNGESTLKSQPGVNYNDDRAVHPVFSTDWSDGLGGCSSAHIPGYIVKGGWKLDRAHQLRVLDPYNNNAVVGTYRTVGDGWGVNQSGPRVDPGQYQARFTFSGLSAGDLAGSGSVPGLGSCNSGICWALQADYSGNSGWEWSSATHFTQPWTLQNTSFIDVYGFRATR